MGATQRLVLAPTSIYILIKLGLYFHFKRWTFSHVKVFPFLPSHCYPMTLSLFPLPPWPVLLPWLKRSRLAPISPCNSYSLTHSSLQGEWSTCWSCSCSCSCPCFCFCSCSYSCSCSCSCSYQRGLPRLVKTRPIFVVQEVYFQPCTTFPFSTQPLLPHDVISFPPSLPGQYYSPG